VRAELPQEEVDARPVLLHHVLPFITPSPWGRKSST
jgi:hypothetical protein